MASSVPQGGGGGAGTTAAVAAVKGEDSSGPKPDPGGQGRAESDGSVGPQPPPEAPERKKTTSFKITNVFLSRPPSNDGDESAEDPDDLDDSHTEENNKE